MCLAEDGFSSIQTVIRETLLEADHIRYRVGWLFSLQTATDPSQIDLSEINEVEADQ